MPMRHTNLCPVTIILVFFSQVFKICNSHYASLNLNDWLGEFDSCDVKVHFSNRWNKVEIGEVIYPISLFTTSLLLKYSSFHKNIFCNVQVFVLMAEDESLDSNHSVDSVEGFCSKPIFDSPKAIQRTQSKYKWTNCICIYVVPDVFGKGRTFGIEETLRSYSELNRKDIQYFLFKYTTIKLYCCFEERLRISEIHYICRQELACDGRLVAKDVPLISWPVLCPNRRKCRAKMEEMVDNKFERVET